MSGVTLLERLGFPSSLRDEFELSGLVERTSAAGWPFLVGGLSFSMEQGYVFAVTANNQSAERLHSDLVVLLGPDRVSLFPHWETLPFERVSPTHDSVGKRQRLLLDLERRSLESGHVVVMSIRALLQRLSDDRVSGHTIPVALGTLLDTDALPAELIALGYTREYQAEAPGEFAVRGSIIDIFDPSSELPVRIDLFGDEVETVSLYDPDTQRTLRGVESIEILPAREVLISSAADAILEMDDARFSAAAPIKSAFDRILALEPFDGMESWLPFFARQHRLIAEFATSADRFVLLEPSRLRARAIDIIDEEVSLASSLAVTWGLDPTMEFPRLHLDFDRAFAESPVPLLLGGAGSGDGGFGGWEFSGREIEMLLAKVRTLLSEGYRVSVLADGEFSAGTIVRSLTGAGIAATAMEECADAAAAGVAVAVFASGSLSQGCVAELQRVAVLSESDLTGRRRAHRPPKAMRRRSTADFEAFEIGGYVVHDTHGVARYMGMTKRELQGIERDYLLLEYRGGDKIYVPSDQMSLITPYSGGEAPQLSRLGGSDWQAAKSRARKAAREIAQELVVLYQKRAVTPGFAFSEDTAFQREMESLFPYELTPDQEVAIREVKEDMQSPRPMDRLVCGDVGFGKTEIAIRAAFKCVQDSKQVAILVPTTLLASQHFQSFADRFANHPVRVEVLSRFLTPAQSKRVIEGVADGSVDVVIGTHKMLSSQVTFQDLGLLIIDEEQRFGVAHKEVIKQIAEGVDVLALTATPIPRTLELSLTGIRDLSLLHTAPIQRRPILTHVGEHDELAISEAIRRELLRDGQVFYVHNRVKDIERVAAKVRELVPEARVAIAHGQMDESLLEQVVIDFWEGSFDVLVCTTIIESGIDMPTVNTMVVDRAELLGLGQLHQLRGRVGRAGIRAYAYLFFPQDAALTEEAFERLRTIGENTELGSGFRIAMKDLEIRGAGNLLGQNQSGHMAAVGYDMYVKMVTEAVSEMKGDLKAPAVPEIVVDVPIAAYIPKGFISREDLRLDTYRRLSTVSDAGELAVISSELADRFGPLPQPLEELVSYVHLKLRLAALGLREVVVKRASVGVGQELKLAPMTLLTSQQLRMRRLYPNAKFSENQSEIVLPFPAKSSAVEFIAEFVDRILTPA